jgi:serine-type D-Ala-D-Ala carboxypeptidase/endopeptidase
MKKIISVISLHCLLLATPLFAQVPSGAIDAAKERIEGNNGTGVTIAYIDGVNIDYHYLSGDGTESKIISPQSIVEIGSITKVFTGTLLAQFVLDGKIDYNKPIKNYLPDEFEIPSKDGKEITALNLVTHRSGLPRLPSNLAPKDPGNPYADYTQDMLLEFLSTHKLKNNPDGKYDYSNLGMALLGLALEHVSGKSYATLVDQIICKPLKMTNTFIDLPIYKRNALVQGFNSDVEVQTWDLSIFKAAGALKSTPEDMARFAQGCMGAIPCSFSEAVEFATSPLFSAGPEFVRIGLSWHIMDFKDGSVIAGHNGATGGYQSHLAYDKAKQKAVVVLVNNGSVDVADIGMHILNTDFKVKRFPKTLELSNEDLQQYVGVYQILPSFSITITVEGTQIFAQASKQKSYEIYPEIEDKFNYRVVVASIVFERNEDGEVTNLVLHQNGQALDGKKVK